MERIGKNELLHRIDEVLFYVWDPIGVRDAPEARAEYRSYVSEILAMVEADCPPAEIARHLADLTKSMGLVLVNRKQNLEVASLLKRHKLAIDEKLA